MSKTEQKLSNYSKYSILALNACDSQIGNTEILRQSPSYRLQMFFLLSRQPLTACLESKMVRDESELSMHQEVSSCTTLLKIEWCRFVPEVLSYQDAILKEKIKGKRSEWWNCCLQCIYTVTTSWVWKAWVQTSPCSAAISWIRSA